MEILRTISLYVEDKDMPFMVIGGHAVTSYGIRRHTSDLDFVVQRSAKERWLALMERLNYEKGQDDERFARFRARSLDNWPIDLMFVDDLTFEKLFEQSHEMNFGQARARVVSPRHLATMKIHALKYFQEHRFSKDFSDLVSLLRSNQTGLTDDELRELCQKYADISLYEKLFNQRGEK